MRDSTVVYRVEFLFCPPANMEQWQLPRPVEYGKLLSTGR